MLMPILILIGVGVAYTHTHNAHIIDKKSSCKETSNKMVMLLLKDDHKTAMLFPTSHYFPIKSKSVCVFSEKFRLFRTGV